MHDFLYYFLPLMMIIFQWKKIVEKPCSNPFSSYPTPSLLKVPLYYKITMKNLKHAFSLFGYITIEFTWEKKFQTFYNNIDNLWLYCKLLLENIRMFHYWTQQFTSFIADLCQDKTWREFVLFEDHRGVSNGTFPWRNCSIKALVY